MTGDGSDSRRLADADTATRLLAAVYDETLMPSDMVVDDLIKRGLLCVGPDYTGETGMWITTEGRVLVARSLMANQNENDGEEVVDA
jgi:hypothetical protein